MEKEDIITKKEENKDSTEKGSKRQFTNYNITINMKDKNNHHQDKLLAYEDT